jgi:hypothetical protein
VNLWDYLDGNFWAVWQWAAVLNPVQAAWRPTPRVASVGWNLQHLGEMLDYYMAHVFGCSPQHRAGTLRTMIAGSLDDGSFGDLEDVAAYHRHVRPAYRGFLEGLRATDFDRPIERRGRRPLTYGWAVGHIAEHESYHLGKCTLLRNLLPAAPRPQAGTML